MSIDSDIPSSKIEHINERKNLRKELQDKSNQLLELQLSLNNAMSHLDIAHNDISLLEDSLTLVEKKFKQAVFEYLRIGGSKDLLKTFSTDPTCPCCTSKNINDGRYLSENELLNENLKNTVLLVPLRIFECLECSQKWIDQ